MLIGISISLLKLAVYVLSPFSIRPFNTWIKVILNVPPAAPSIWATFGLLLFQYGSHLSVLWSPW